MRQTHYSRNEKLVLLSLLVALAAYAALTLPAAAQTQTFVPPVITTDAGDYSSGTEVFIAGDHWSPGEFVALHIREDGNPEHVDTLYATADAAGSLTAEYVVPGHGTARMFTLTATGASSGAQASAVFSNAYYPGSFWWDTADWATAAPESTPWIRTNRDDYQPGDYALFAGGGWFPGDLVTLTLALTGSEHVHPNVQLHAVADETGSISAAYVLQPHDLGESYALTAASAADPTALARTTFSDSGFNFDSCALTTGGGAKCWGANALGQLGDGTTSRQVTPVSVSGLTSGVVEISTGAEHTCALTIGGSVKCWGRNDFGQVGDGSTTQRLTSVDVNGLTSNVAQVAAGADHTCALTTGGAVKCWGNNDNGRLGDGTTTHSTAPVDVIGLSSDVAQVRGGQFHTCAVTTNGGVKCWGWNVFGQVGDGTTVDAWIPVDVSGLTSGVIQVSTGGDHSCALTTSGGVKCWGANFNGQLGDNSTTNRLTPVDVSGLTSGVVQIATGTFHTCALTTGGGVKCWGNQGAGRLGNGLSTGQRTTPGNVNTLSSGVAQIYTGGDHTCALTTAGGVMCWGYNGFGQVGDNSTASRFVPVNVSGLTTGVIAVPEVKASTYTLTYLAGAHGTITGAPAQILYSGQSGTAVTAVPDAGYHFVSWSDGLLSATRTDSNVIASLTVTASFAPSSHTLTYNAEAHGTISGASPQTVNDGADGTPVTAAPDTGYHFVAWSDGVLTATRTDTHVPTDIAVTASFAINTYTLTYGAGAHGTLNGTSPQTANYGASGSKVTAVPDAGYVFVKWSDESTANPRTDANVTANIAVSASFAEVPYVVTGFFAPIDMPQANVVVWNSAQAGQTVPVKWRLTKNGVPVADPNSFLSDPGGLFSYPIDCSSLDGSVDLAIEEYAPGNSPLAYKGEGNWQFNWQTVKAYKNSCRVMFVRFRDGTVSAAASFKFK